MYQENNITESEDEQKIRSDLRENFLKKILLLNGKQCELKMHENTSVRGVFRGTDVDMEEILISGLETPTSTLPHAIIRGNDTIAIEFIETLIDDKI